MNRSRNQQPFVRRVFGAFTALVTTSVVVAMSALPASAGSPLAVARETGRACGPAWSFLNSPNPSPNGNELRGVDGISATDVWAVGGKDVDADTSQHGNGTTTLTMHWNGTAWTVKPSPTISGIYTELYGVAAISASNAWAVGISSNPGPDSTSGPTEFNHGLILHWDGLTWTKVANPLGSTNNVLLSVFALGASNVYAAGFVGRDGGPTQVPMVLHYDGSSWKRMAVPAGRNAGFTAIGASASPSGNVWAVGWRGPFQGNDSPFAERYDGSAWHIVSPSSPSSGSLNSVLVFGPNKVWAGGAQGSNLFSDSTALAERFNGTSWSQVKTAPPSDPVQRFNGIAAASDSSIWAVGDTGDGPMGALSLIEHSTGSAFSRQPSPNPPGNPTTSLQAVVAFGAREFAVGLSHPSGIWRTVVVRRCG